VQAASFFTSAVTSTCFKGQHVVYISLKIGRLLSHCRTNNCTATSRRLWEIQ